MSRTQKKIGSGFGSKSEASEVLAGKDLSGKVAIVTGGYSGIGLETTRALIDAGAKVYVPVRTPEKVQANLADIDGEVIVDTMDLGDLASVRAYADAVSQRESALHLLINNAGIMACPETRIGNNWEAQFAVNHLGHFVLTTALLPLLLNADGNISEQAKAMFKSTTQGCSTTLWAATSAALADTGGLYCEDCDVANLATEDSPRYFDVAPWAASEEGAVRLWDLTEAMLV